MRPSPLLAAGALIALAVALAAYLQRGANEPPTEREPSVAPPIAEAPEPAAAAAPAAEPDVTPEPEREPEELGGRSSESLASLEDEPQEPADGADEDEPALAGGDEYEIVYRALSERFEGEPRGTPEGAALERDVQNRLAQDPVLARDHVEVECGTTVCRVQVIGAERVEELRALDFAGFGAKTGNVLPNDDGSETTEMLLEHEAAPP